MTRLFALYLFLSMTSAAAAQLSERASPISAITNCGTKISATLRSVRDGVFISGSCDKIADFRLASNGVVFKTCTGVKTCSGAAGVEMMQKGENTISSTVTYNGCEAGLIGYVDLP